MSKRIRLGTVLALLLVTSSILGCPSGDDPTVEAAPKTGIGPVPTPLPPLPDQPKAPAIGGAPAPQAPSAAKLVD